MSNVLNSPLVVAEALKARTEFLKATANFFACLRQPADEVMESITAATALEKEFRDDLEGFGQPETLGQSSYDAREFCRKSLRNAIYDGLCRALVTIYNRGVVSLAMRATDSANDEFLEVRYRAGELQRPPVVRQKSAAELLDEEIRSDWEKLPADKIRAKENNLAYRKRLRELLDSDSIKSQISALHDGREIGG